MRNRMGGGGWEGRCLVLRRGVLILVIRVRKELHTLSELSVFISCGSWFRGDK